MSVVTSGGRSAEGSAPAYRPDLDGLRAFAIALVVVYHVWLGRVSGGVDVFLLLSAYFLTGSMLRRAEAGRPLAVPSYWARRFWRLMPAAALTILAILGVVFLAYPPSTWATMWSQAGASLLSYQNWELAFGAVDYYDRSGELPSPFQHFWSLSIQGQMFLLWPLLLLLCVGIARLVRGSVRVVSAVVFGLIFAGSLGYSVVTTASQQEFAYFDTVARLWEFALGSLAAILLTRVRLPRVLALLLGWAGVAGLVLCGVVLDAGTRFPGYYALWPTLAALAVIVAGSAAPGRGAARMLSSGPLRRLAGSSYALYLVHWPLLTFWMLFSEQERPGLVEGLLIIVASFLIAVLVSEGVERPLRLWRWASRGFLRPAIAVATTIVVVAVPLVSWQVVEYRRAVDLVASSDHPGAALVDLGVEIELAEAEVIPLGSALDAEWVTLDGGCRGAVLPSGGDAAQTCVETYDVDAGAPRIVVVGDSHAQQWMGSILPGARERGWHLIGVLKGGCSFTVPFSIEEESEECRVWREEALSYIVETEPDVVLTMATKTVADTPEEDVIPGLDLVADLLGPTPSELVMVRDTPRFDEDMYACLERDGVVDCERPRGSVLAGEDPALVLDGTGAHLLDFSGYFCPDDLCPPAIGNVAVYIDDNHVSWAFMDSLSAVVDRELASRGIW